MRPLYQQTMKAWILTIMVQQLVLLMQTVALTHPLLKNLFRVHLQKTWKFGNVKAIQIDVHFSRNCLL